MRRCFAFALLVVIVIFVLLGFQFNITNVFRAVFAAFLVAFQLLYFVFAVLVVVFILLFVVLYFLRFFNQLPRTSDPGFNNGRQQRLTLILTIDDCR